MRLGKLFVALTKFAFECCSVASFAMLIDRGEKGWFVVTGGLLRTTGSTITAGVGGVGERVSGAGEGLDERRDFGMIGSKSGFCCTTELSC